MTRAVLLLVGDEYEDLELQYPKLRLREAGYVPVVAGQVKGHSYRGKYGYPCHSDRAIGDCDANAFEGILLPGGWMPDKLRRDASALALVRAFDQQKKLLASICHGPWIAISANVVRGVRYTGSLGIRDDLINAGALWHDAAVVIDGHHVSSRKPDDLPEFTAAMLQVLDLQIH